MSNLSQISRMSEYIKKATDSYPMTRSQIRRIDESEKIVSEWKQLVGVETVNDEFEYMKSFDGKVLGVYEPKWYSNKHQPTQYQGRDMHYSGEEEFTFDDLHNGSRKMYTIAETDEWLIGFQFKCYYSTFNNEYSGFQRLEMSAVHK